ncbi:MAG: hypothetical protein LC118_08025 [Dehalococcoidia bacterium]|nr:hypothetical protein [Dehalococcoidia bacterium]
MRPSLDPKVGNQRQKGLLQKLAQQAMQRKGYTSALGRFAKLGTGRSPIGRIGGARGGMGQVSKLFGSLGAATPKGLEHAIKIGEGYVSANPPSSGPSASQVGLSQQPQYNPGDTIPPAAVGSNPFVTGQPGSAGLGGPATSDPEHNAFLGGLSDIDPFGGFSTTPQTSPSSPIATPGGFVPLGGGLYYDPVHDVIRGQGGHQVN